MPSKQQNNAAILGVVLAGGLSRRMGGGDKSLLSLGGRSLLDRVIERLAGQLPAGREGVVLNANGDPERFAEFGAPVTPDSVPGFAGPLAGVLAGLDYAAERGAERIVTVAADTPFFPADLVAGLEAAAEREGAPLACAATPDESGVLRDHPTFGLWRTDLREDLRRALVEEELRKVVRWTARHGCARAEFSVPLSQAGAIDPFFNVNTPDDMRVAEAYIAERIE